MSHRALSVGAGSEGRCARHQTVQVSSSSRTFPEQLSHYLGAYSAQRSHPLPSGALMLEMDGRLAWLFLAEGGTG